MSADDLIARCLQEAFEMFPEGCICEDSLDCRYCRCVVAAALRAARKRTGDFFGAATEELCDEGSALVIPISEDAQVYELRRLFRV